MCNRGNFRRISTALFTRLFLSENGRVVTNDSSAWNCSFNSEPNYVYFVYDDKMGVHEREAQLKCSYANKLYLEVLGGGG